MGTVQSRMLARGGRPLGGLPRLSTLEPGSVSCLWGDTSNIVDDNVSMLFCVSIPSDPCAGHGGVLKIVPSLPVYDQHMRFLFMPDVVTDMSWQRVSHCCTRFLSALVIE